MSLPGDLKLFLTRTQDSESVVRVVKVSILLPNMTVQLQNQVKL